MAVWGRRKQLSEQVFSDPHFDYMVGRLVGAAEMLCHYQALYGDERGRTMADIAHNTISFFLKEEDRYDLPKPIDEQPTLEMRGKEVG